MDSFYWGLSDVTVTVSDTGINLHIVFDTGINIHIFPLWIFSA